MGKPLLKALLSRRAKVRLLSRRPPTEQTDPRLEYVQGDLLDVDFDLNGLLDGVTLLFNCAGELRDESRMHALHVSSIERLLATCANSQQRLHWVQLSSVGVYGPPNGRANEPRVVREVDALKPRGVYETTKACSDELLISAGARGDITYTILRPSIVFGPRMPNDSLRQLIKVIRAGRFFYIGGRQAISTYVHLDDVVAALLECGFNPNASMQIFNLSCDVEQQALIEAVALHYRCKPPQWVLPEVFVRIAGALLSRVEGFPLTSSRIDSLVARSRYPSDKLHKVLGTKLSKSILTTFEDVSHD